MGCYLVLVHLGKTYIQTAGMRALITYILFVLDLGPMHRAALRTADAACLFTEKIREETHKNLQQYVK
jgi:hypothetical protein